MLEYGGGSICELKISRHDDGEIPLSKSASARTVSRQRVEVEDGRSWLVYSEDVPTPEGVSRARKATGQTTPIAIAIPQYSVSHGQIHAGLPIIQTHLPLFANAQFDPLTSRRDLADTKWNESLIPLVAELWSEATLDLFARDPKAAWQAIPIPDAANRDDTSPMVQRLKPCELLTGAQGPGGQQVEGVFVGAGQLHREGSDKLVSRLRHGGLHAGDEPGLSAPAFAQKREWAPLGGKIVGQTSTTVRGLALQRTFTFRSRLVP